MTTKNRHPVGEAGKGSQCGPNRDTPSYTAVIFSSRRTEGDRDEDRAYARMSERMFALAAEQPGYLGVEATRDESLGITVSYWAEESAAAAWKQVAEHLVAQERGAQVWYADYRVRVATVTRDYGAP